MKVKTKKTIFAIANAVESRIKAMLSAFFLAFTKPAQANAQKITQNIPKKERNIFTIVATVPSYTGKKNANNPNSPKATDNNAALKNFIAQHLSFLIIITHIRRDTQGFY